MKKKTKRSSRAAPQRLTSWSYSRWYDYEDCPRKARYKHLDRLPESEGPALLRGQKIHDEGEVYLNAKRGPVPKSFEQFTQELIDLRKAKATAEESWGFTEGWSPADWRSAWVRMKIDANHLIDPAHLRVVDFKTGKVRGSHARQVELYALGGFAQHGGTLKTVTCELWYLDSGEQHEYEYRVEEVPDLKQTWERRTSKMLKDTKFLPNPGRACQWCSFAKSKGGPCEKG